MRSKTLERIIKEIPLETRVKVAIEAHFLHTNGGTFFIPLNENGDELPEILKINKKCMKLSKPLVDSVMEEIKGWRKDGMP